MAELLPADELVKLLRFQQLDERNGAISGEPDAIRLCGAAADEIKRLQLLAADYGGQLTAETAETKRLRIAIHHYVRARKANSGDLAHYWYTLQEIVKEDEKR